MTQTKVTFKNAAGQALAGVLHGTLGSFAVISCHGMLSCKDGVKHVALGEALEQRDVPMLRFDFAGCGDSEGELFAMTCSGRVKDVDAAVAFLAAQGVERFGLFGSSVGGTVALLAAARDERIVGVATLAAVAHIESTTELQPSLVRDWEEKGYIETASGRLGRAFYDDARAHDVVAAVRILHAPLLVLHGEDDPTVPVSDAHDIASAARNASLEIVDGAGHRFENPVHLRPAIRMIADFLARLAD